MLPNKEPKDGQILSILCHEGGAGDIISQIPVVKGFRERYKDDFIIVLTTYAQIWENNPYPDKVISLSNIKNFYEKYIVGKNIRFVRKRFLYNHVYEHEFEPFLGAPNLREFACRCYGVDYPGPPELFLSEDEKRQAKVFMNQTDKKKILVHAFSAVPSEQLETMLCGGCGGRGIGPDGNRCQMCGGRGKVSLMQKTNRLKDISEETAQHIVKLAQKYSQQGYEFLQVGLEGEPLIGGGQAPIVDCLGLPMRDVFSMINECSSYIFIESLFQHAAGALRKPGVVILQNTGEFFAYPEVAHIVKSREKCPLGLTQEKCGRPVGALWDLLGSYKNPKNIKELLLWECPDQTCNKITYEDLEKAFVASLEGPPRADDGHNSLESARSAPPPKKVNQPIDLQKAIEAAAKKNSPDLKVVKNDEQPKKVVTAKTTKKGSKKRGRKPKNVKQSSPPEDTKK